MEIANRDSKLLSCNCGDINKNNLMKFILLNKKGDEEENTSNNIIEDNIIAKLHEKT